MSDLTILTPVLNAARFMPGCLDNVLGQDCPEAEHLVVDGGSTDGTLDIVWEAAEKNPGRVRLLSAPGTSQSQAMNQGIAEAEGEILGILNADDFYEPGVLNRALALIAPLRAPAFVCGNCNVLDTDGRVTSVNKPARLGLSDLLAGRPYPWNPAAYFYHKALHNKVGPYDEADPLTMDLDFLLRAIPHATVRYIDETWGNFRYIPGAKTFEQGGGIQARVDKLRNHYLCQASRTVNLSAHIKMLSDRLTHKLTRRFSSVSHD